jgi:lipopolysaccharide export system protein LptA
LNGNIKPLSKIIITSDKAVCQKDDTKKNITTFTYQENVIVTFADKSSIHSDELELQIDTSKTTTFEQNKTEQFKKITFKHNVCAKRENRILKADIAELYLKEKMCKLIGKVHIKQMKEKIKDIPIDTFCNHATLNLETEYISFEGTKKTPVCTTIELSEYPSLMKKPKTKAQKKAEKRSLKAKKKRK